MLSYQYEAEPTATEITGYAGLLPYLELAYLLGVPRAVEAHVKAGGTQGWRDSQHVLALLLLNLAGGDCMGDIQTLEADRGLCRMVRQAECHRLTRKERREQERRFRKGRVRTFPAPSRICEWLEQFHDPAQEQERVEGKAFIPQMNAHLSGLGKVNQALLTSMQHHAPCQEATLDIDATLQETCKREALFCYKGGRAYQPLNVYWAETGAMLRSEFRDGNVPAGYGILGILRESVTLVLSWGIKQLLVRMDSAGYQYEVLTFMATGDGGKLPVIEFTVSNDMTAEFRAAVRQVPEGEWRPLPRVQGAAQEWAEVVYVPQRLALSKLAPDYRYLAIREKVEQGILPGMVETVGQAELPFATEQFAGVTYRLSGIVTNRREEGAKLIRWHHQRCGKSEEAHAILKRDLAGGRSPSGKFGANAAWWAIVVLAYNLHVAMQRLALPGNLTGKRLKALRFALLSLPGRVVERGRQLFVRLGREHPALGWLSEMHRKIRALALAPG